MTNTPVNPTMVQNDWFDACTAPATAESGGAVSGGVVVNPSAIGRAGQSWHAAASAPNIVELRLKYKTGVTGVTSPVVQTFGRDAAGKTMRLVDPVAGAHALTLTVDAANDVRDSDGYSYTQPVLVDLDGARAFIAAVKTAFAASDPTGATIEARLTT
jgi:hypothetical protein